MALHEDRGRRYQTASELAADVERHRRGEAVVAAPPGTSYHVLHVRGPQPPRRRILAFFRLKIHTDNRS